jgi:MscS family membrane protein
VTVSETSAFLNQAAGPFTWGQLLSALGLVIAAYVLRAVVISQVSRRLLNLVARTKSRADDLAVAALITPLGWLLPLIGLYLALRILAVDHPELVEVAAKGFVIAVTLVVTWALFKLIDALAVLAVERAQRTESPVDNAIVPTLRKALKTFLGVVVFVVLVQNLGYSVSGLLGALGVGGLAVALAAKETLANLFGGITILVDRPFRPGDWITFDQTDGVVEEIGLRSTRIRTFAKTLISVPNSTLANATVENHTKMPKRRISFHVGITYRSKPDEVRAAVARIESFLRGNPDIDQEFLMVKFTTFNNSSLDILVYCFSVTTNWVQHLQVRQDVNLAIMDILADLGLEIAFPTRTVHLASGQIDGAPAAAD